MTRKINKRARDLLEQADPFNFARGADIPGFVGAATESPVEELLVAALFATNRWRIAVAGEHAYLPRGVTAPRGLIASTKKLPGRAFIVPQLSWELRDRSIRIDLAVLIDMPWIQRSTALAVEIDGHDFHERTKAQARRDRSRDRGLAALGWTPVRFTGSEIWADPFDCAEELTELVQESPSSSALEVPKLSPLPSAAPDEEVPW